MRLFVYCHHCKNKIYVNSHAKTRYELPFNFILKCSIIKCYAHSQDRSYSRNEVQAESGQSGAVSGAIILGVLGAVVGGGAGALLGGLIGATAGSNSDQDRLAVERFNNS